MPSRVHQLVVLIDNYKYAEDRVGIIKAALHNMLAASDLDVFPWQVVEQEFYRVMKADIEGNEIQQYTIIFLVCIGVLNTILMNILERTGEFGVLKAIGTTPQRIFSQIFIEALMLALLSCLVGLIVAIPINWYLVDFGLQLPEPMEMSGLTIEAMTGEMSVWIFLRPAVIILFATGLIALYPAYRAAKIVPLDAMRNL